MNAQYGWRQRFAVQGLFWRHALDWAVAQVPFYFLPLHMLFVTTFFFFFAAPARRAVLANLRLIFPKSGPALIYLRAWQTLNTFAWTLRDAAQYKQLQRDYSYELEGTEHLEALATAGGAIVLTAHMGNYDLGAAIFARKFGRPLRIVRAPEPDQQSAQHLHSSLETAGGGGVKVDYNTGDNLLPFDLLGALRQGEVVSIQGDRASPGTPSLSVTLFGQPFAVPAGPFVLGYAAETPIFPLFVVRSAYRVYRIIVFEPLVMTREGGDRATALRNASQQWAAALERTITQFPEQWFALETLTRGHGTN